MNTMKDLLERVVDDEDLKDAGPVNPLGDLARGRSRLRRRRTGFATATAAVLVGGLAAATLAGQSAATPGSGPTVAQSSSSIDLVSFTGKQPRGYTVAWVPKGWEIQGGDLAYLVIAPPADIVAQQKAVAAQKDAGRTGRVREQLKGAKTFDELANDPTYLGDKLSVISSSSTEDHTAGQQISIAGRPGYVRKDSDGTQLLSFKSADGRWVDVQAPAQLGWGSTQLAKFAAGITVSKKAAVGGAG